MNGKQYAGLRLIGFRLAWVGLALLVAGCRGEKAAPSVLPELRLGLQDNTICALAFLAQARGLFEAEGLHVTVVSFPSGKLALQAMLAGEVDVAASADMPIASQAFNVDSFAVIATIAGTEDGAWILARRDAGIATPADLRGKRIGTQRNSAVHFFLSMFLLHHGIPEDAVDIRFMAATELPEALLKGDLDAFSMRNPFVRTAREALGERSIEFFGRNVYRQTFDLVAGRALLAARGADIEALLRAFVAARQGVLDDGAAARDAVTAFLGVDRAAEIADDWPRYEFTVSLDQSLFLTLEDQARWLHQQGLAATNLPNFAEFVDIRFLEAVRPDAVTVIR